MVTSPRCHSAKSEWRLALGMVNSGLNLEVPDAPDFEQVPDASDQERNIRTLPNVSFSYEADHRMYWNTVDHAREQIGSVQWSPTLKIPMFLTSKSEWRLALGIKEIHWLKISKMISKIGKQVNFNQIQIIFRDFPQQLRLQIFQQIAWAKILLPFWNIFSNDMICFLLKRQVHRFVLVFGTLCCGAPQCEDLKWRELDSWEMTRDVTIFALQGHLQRCHSWNLRIVLVMEPSYLGFSTLRTKSAFLRRIKISCSWG